MSSPDLATVVIACPNCGTRYQVPHATIGPAGREVQCAQCGKPWHATADAPPPPAIVDDLLFSSEDEAALDESFEAVATVAAPPRPLPAAMPMDAEHARTLAEIRAAIAPRAAKANANALDPALLTKSVQAFDKRQASITRALPMARLRRLARLAALVTLLSMLVFGFALRTNIVGTFPALAGLYAAMGLPVNVTGLEFEGAKTLTSLRDGKTIMTITAHIRSVSGGTVDVPPVLVSLFDAKGGSIYEWTVAPQAADLNPGEVLDFSTEVDAPPDGAVTVRLSFTNPRDGTPVPTLAKAS
jgi:predicted Zn finger-like uncharacterized protein